MSPAPISVRQAICHHFGIRFLSDQGRLLHLRSQTTQLLLPAPFDADGSAPATLERSWRCWKVEARDYDPNVGD